MFTDNPIEFLTHVEYSGSPLSEFNYTCASEYEPAGYTLRKTSGIRVIKKIYKGPKGSLTIYEIDKKAIISKYKTILCFAPKGMRLSLAKLIEFAIQNPCGTSFYFLLRLFDHLQNCKLEKDFDLENSKAICESLECIVSGQLKNVESPKKSLYKKIVGCSSSCCGLLYGDTDYKLITEMLLFE